MHSILEFLQLIQDFLSTGNIVRSSVHLFPVVSVRKEPVNNNTLTS